mmetsp:Transcript_110567/g.253145  ORF Transcript_110567/g.253145 Transcript_110567/m.253145 type:complete len:981 (+) Transcript_110567:20-2962(+)
MAATVAIPGAAAAPRCSIHGASTNQCSTGGELYDALRSAYEARVRSLTERLKQTVTRVREVSGESSAITNELSSAVADEREQTITRLLQQSADLQVRLSAAERSLASRPSQTATRRQSPPRGKSDLCTAKELEAAKGEVAAARAEAGRAEAGRQEACRAETRAREEARLCAQRVAEAHAALTASEEARAQLSAKYLSLGAKVEQLCLEGGSGEDHNREKLDACRKRCKKLEGAVDKGHVEINKLKVQLRARELDVEEWKAKVHEERLAATRLVQAAPPPPPPPVVETISLSMHQQLLQDLKTQHGAELLHQRQQADLAAQSREQAWEQRLRQALERKQLEFEDTLREIRKLVQELERSREEDQRRLQRALEAKEAAEEQLQDRGDEEHDLLAMQSRLHEAGRNVDRLRQMVQSRDNEVEELRLQYAQLREEVDQAAAAGDSRARRPGDGGRASARSQAAQYLLLRSHVQQLRNEWRNERARVASSLEGFRGVLADAAIRTGRAGSAGTAPGEAQSQGVRVAVVTSVETWLLPVWQAAKLPASMLYDACAALRQGDDKSWQDRGKAAASIVASQHPEDPAVFSQLREAQAQAELARQGAAEAQRTADQHRQEAERASQYLARAEGEAARADEHRRRVVLLESQLEAAHQREASLQAQLTAARAAPVAAATVEAPAAPVVQRDTAQLQKAQVEAMELRTALHAAEMRHAEAEENVRCARARADKQMDEGQRAAKEGQRLRAELNDAVTSLQRAKEEAAKFEAHAKDQERSAAGHEAAASRCSRGECDAARRNRDMESRLDIQKADLRRTHREELRKVEDEVDELKRRFVEELRTREEQARTTIREVREAASAKLHHAEAATAEAHAGHQQALRQLAAEAAAKQQMEAASLLVDEQASEARAQYSAKLQRAREESLRRGQEASVIDGSLEAFKRDIERLSQEVQSREQEMSLARRSWEQGEDVRTPSPAKMLHGFRRPLPSQG